LDGNLSILAQIRFRTGNAELQEFEQLACTRFG